MPEPIGGYFELELPRGHHPFPNAREFNSARSAFQAMLLARRIKRVLMPFFICSVMPEAARSIGVEVAKYSVNNRLELMSFPTLASTDALLYVDYFGLKHHYITSTLVTRYRSCLIVDNSQALFSAPIENIPSLYSPRKFVGVPDGGWLVNATEAVEQPPAGESVGRFDALLGRLADGPESHYADFQRTERMLGVEGMKGMSRLTGRLLDSIDFPSVVIRRTANFSQLHQALTALNEAKWIPIQPIAALCYPFLTQDVGTASTLREALLKERIFVPCYWPEILEDSSTPVIERDLCGRLLPLPIDQRYEGQDIRRLISVIHNHYQ